jgi:4-azaleucine resistance transporter AzlC
MLSTRTKTFNEFRQGFIDTFPLWIGVAPFGIAYSLAAQTAGISPAEVQAMSLLVFAGAAQFTAAGLIAGGADALSIIITTLVINLRHLLFSASLGAIFPKLAWWKKMGIAATLVDESYALTIQRVSDGKAGAGLVFGAGIGFYVCWQLSTLTGLLLTSAIPDPASLGLGLVFPLSFTVLLVPYLKTKPAWAAVFTSAILAISLRVLIPGNWYLLIAAVGGCIVGGLLDKNVPPQVEKGE